MIAVLVIGLAAGPAPIATAAVVTVGPQLTGGFSPENYGEPDDPPATVLNAKLSPGLGTVASPISGTVVGWSVVQAAGGPFKLRIVQPNGGTSVTAVGTSAPAAPASRGIQTFPTSLPIKAGQTIALDNSRGSDEIGLLMDPGAEYEFSETAITEGVPTTLEPGFNPIALGFNAQVLPAPTVTALSSKSGSIKGGAQVTISGTDLSRATAVTFGAAPATSIAVVSESQITAATPAAKKAGAIPVSVTTPAGTATAAEQFTYEACKVPKLAGKKLAKAKRRLKKAHCRLGGVKLLGDADRKTGKVSKQSPKAGKLLAPGSKVRVKLR
ncbi:MAG TPA: IPT/TIG domain-containing protein [Solirubrobacterales bacterium]